jgi:hypothetical protein
MPHLSAIYIYLLIFCAANLRIIFTFATLLSS